MLYDPKWEHKTETKADPLSLESLIAWIATQQPADEYCYADNGHCLLARYLSAAFGQEPLVGSVRFDLYGSAGCLARNVRIPDDWNNIAKVHPRTFGAALVRARDVLARA